MNYTDAMDLACSRSDLIRSDLEILQQFIEARKDLAGNIVELGSYRCGSTIAMAQVTDKEVYAFDLFGGIPYEPCCPAFDKFGDVDIDEIFRHTCRFPNITLVIGKHEDQVPRFAVQPLSFIFMDSDFYSSHFVGLTYFWPMLVSQGAIVFHDWLFREVQQALYDTLEGRMVTFCGQLPGSTMGAIVKK